MLLLFHFVQSARTGVQFDVHTAAPPLFFDSANQRRRLTQALRCAKSTPDARRPHGSQFRSSKRNQDGQLSIRTRQTFFPHTIDLHLGLSTPVFRDVSSAILPSPLLPPNPPSLDHPSACLANHQEGPVNDKHPTLLRRGRPNT